MTNQQSNKELVKAGHAFAAALSTDTPIIDMAKLFSELATRLDLLQARKKGLTAENIQLRALVARVITQYGQAGYSSEQDSLNPAKALMFDAEQLLVGMPVADMGMQLEGDQALMLAMRDDSRESRSKLELVVAENVTLKGGILKCTEAVENWNSWADAEDKITLHTETPATDAMVNEIRAEGVELAINHLMNKFEGTGHIGVPVMALESLANQLRGDAAKVGE